MSRQVTTKFAENAIVVRERVRKRDEDDDGRRVRRERALEDVVNNESAACFDAIFNEHTTAAG